MVQPVHPWTDEEGIVHPELIQHYSDLALVLEQVETGRHYSDPVDVYPCRYSYIETDIPIELEV